MYIWVRDRVSRNVLVLWRTRPEFTRGAVPPSLRLLLYVVYVCQNHKILWMHSIVTSKNES